jgi:hypothetical protein
MKKTISIIILSILIALLLSACASMIMPYAEEPLCRKGVEGGYCGSLSDVYDAVSYEQYSKQTHNRNNTKGDYLK